MTQRLQRLSVGLFCLAVWTAACGGLPDTVRNQAEVLDQQLDAQAKQLDQRQAAFTKRQESAEFAPFRPYAEREQWMASFAQARAELEHARATYQKEVVPRLDTNRQEDAASLRQHLARIRTSVNKSKELMHYPFQRVAFLQDVQARAPELVEVARQEVTQAETRLQVLAAEVEQSATDYPSKREDLSDRLAAIQKLTREARTTLSSAQQQLAALDSGQANLAVLGDAVTQVGDRTAQAETADEQLRTKMTELYRSYAKTLLDMKETSVVTITRTSWNDNYDFPAEHNVSYRNEVETDIVDALERWSNRPLAYLGSSWLGGRRLRLNIDQQTWDALQIDPTLRWPGGDTDAEFWFEDSQARYYHRYLTVEGTDSTESDWELVPESLYAQHLEHLGMDIVSKPYGIYEDEALQHAAPPGLAYVGNPAYGHWEADNQGRRYWSWADNFLFYYLLFGGRRHYYYYNDWNDWSRDYRGRRSYYGREENPATYGTYGSTTQNSPRYRSSTIGRRGGFRRPDSSVRGAGALGRGGGPGGRGK